MPAMRPVTAAVASAADAPVRVSRTSAAQNVVENSIADPHSIDSQKNHSSGGKRVSAGRSACATGAGRSSDGSPRRLAVAIPTPTASSTVAATAGRHPHPAPIVRPTASGARIPMPEPSPFASVTADGPAGPWCTTSAGCAAVMVRLPPSARTNTAGSVAASTDPLMSATTPTTMRTVPTRCCTRRPNRPASVGVIDPDTTEPTAMAVPCRPARPKEIPCSSAICGTIGVNA